MKRVQWVIALVAIATIIAVPFLPGRYPQRAWRILKRQWLIATGGMYDVGGYYLRIECQGSGDSTVVFDSGLSQPRDTWGVVPGEVSKFARVCTYDRAGVGESDRAGFVRTSEDVVRELRTLLGRAREKGPFILVGHSFGGLNVRLFASDEPDDVAGLVLVDPSHEGQYQKLASDLPHDEAEEFLAHEGGENDEQMDMLTSASKMQSIAGPSAIPTILLSAQPSSPEDALIAETVANLYATTIGRSHCGRQIILSNTGHFVQLERPTAVIDSINQLVRLPRGECPHADSLPTAPH
jgi:pimeloyl-ACP methyl ester carboxylesterase